MLSRDPELHRLEITGDAGGAPKAPATWDFLADRTTRLVPVVGQAGLAEAGVGDQAHHMLDSGYVRPLATSILQISWPEPGLGHPAECWRSRP